jgi:hypothetical protein
MQLASCVVCLLQRALELIAGMVTRKNLTDIVRRLSEHVDSAEGAYRDALIDKIIFMCSRDKYEYLEDFAWYISVLIKLAYIQVRRAAGVVRALGSGFGGLHRCLACRALVSRIPSQHS